MHATIGIPNGRGLLSPIITTVATKAKLRNYKNKSTKLNQATKQVLQDWITLLPCALCQPMPCTDLMPAPADYGSFCDASKQGAGGMWFGFGKKLPPIVWRVQFLVDIQNRVVSQDNPHRSITNLDLEMTGLLLQWLLLEKFTNLEHAHVAIWCNNTPTVVWATKLLATKAVLVARLLRTLALQMIACWASPWTALDIPSNLNNMADFASRSFLQFVSTCEFLTEFQNHFSLLQNTSWVHCQLPSEMIGHMLASLSTTTSSLALWHWHTQHASITGGTGANSFPPVSIHTFKEQLNKNGCFLINFCLTSSRRCLWKRTAGANQQHPGSHQCHWQDHQIGWHAEPTPPTRNNKLSCSLSATDQNIQKIQPSHEKTACSTSRSSKFHFPHHEKHNGLANQGHWGIEFGCFLLFTKGWQVYAPWKRTAKDPAIPASRYLIFCKEPSNTSGRTGGKTRPSQYSGTNDW